MPIDIGGPNSLESTRKAPFELTTASVIFWNTVPFFSTATEEKNRMTTHRSLTKTVYSLFAALVLSAAVFGQGAVYNSIPNTLAPSYPSQPFQAQQTAEFGDFVHLGPGNRTLNTVTFTMVNWALQSTPANVTYCTNNPGLCDANGFLHPFTITLYNPGTGTPGTRNVGSVITTATQTKRVLWRPAADPTCANPTQWRASDSLCYNGYAFNLTFDLSSLGVTLPNDVIVGIAYNTQSYGAAPIGVDGPYNSLNVSAVGNVTAGTDDNSDYVYWNTSTAGYYTDGGAAGVGVFREDSNWGIYGTTPIRITTTQNRVVRPSAQLDWVSSTTTGGTVGFVADGTAPSGAGALHLTTINDNDSRTQYSRSVNTALSQLFQASYWSKTVSGPPYAGPSYALGVYLDGTPLTFTNFVFEPYWNNGGTVPQGVWQNWDVLSSSSLWSSRTVNAGGSCVTTAGSGGPPFYSLAAIKAACPNALVVSHTVYMGSYNPNFDTYVDLVNFNGTVYDMEPEPTTVVVDDDGQASATDCGASDPASTTIQGGINSALAGDIVKVCPGNYVEDVNVNKANIILQGSGIDISTITGTKGDATQDTVVITAAGVTVDGFTITRNGNTVADWNDANGIINDQGINVAASANVTIQNSKITGNRNGIYVGQSSNNVIIKRNLIDFNRTGVHLVDNTGALIEENFITNNWTMGILYREEAPLGTPDPTGIAVRNNNISGNWYSEIEFREPAGSALMNMSGNYLGTTSPTRVTTPSGEPGYPSQIPVFYGGSSVPPASHPTVAGPQSGRVDYSPFLNSGTDTQPGTPGFQGDFTNVTVNADSPQAFGLANNIQEGIAAAITGGSVTALSGTYTGNVVINKAVTLLGTPTITGSVSTTTAGATIAPGLSPGIINTGNLSLTSGSNVNIELNGLTPGTLHDQINVTGTVSLGNATLNVTTSFSPLSGNSFVIINNDGGDAVAGTFNGLAEGASLVVSGNTFNISYVGGDGNDVVLTASILTCNNLTTGALNSLRNVNVDVPINVDSTTGRGIISYDFSVQYNPQVITFVNTQNTGTLSSGMVNTYNVVPISPTLSQVNVSGFTTTPLVGAGVLLNLRFTAIGAIGTSSAVDITSFMFNNGPPCVNFSDGSVTIVSGNLTGNVAYGVQAGPTPLAKPVPGTTVSGAGSVPVSTSTDGCGNYLLDGFGAGAYTVTPTKSGNVNNITTFDAGIIAQHVVGIVNPGYTPFNAGQLAAADVSNDNFVNSFDAALIAQWIVLVPNPGITGTWKFAPASRNYTNMETSVANDNYIGYLMGEVSGDWVAPGTCGLMFEPFEPPAGEAIKLVVPDANADAGSVVQVPLRIGDLSKRNVIAYQFDVSFDPDVIRPEQIAADSAETLSNGLHLVYNSPEPGLLKVGVFGVRPIEGEGTLLNLRFNAVGAAGSRSPVEVKAFILNEGRIPVDVTNGHVTVVNAPGATVEGRVLTSAGRPVAKAIVTLTSSSGQTRSLTANQFGRFQFGQLPFGETFTLGVRAKNLRFTPIAVATSESVVRLDMIAEP